MREDLALIVGPDPFLRGSSERLVGVSSTSLSLLISTVGVAVLLAGIIVTVWLSRHNTTPAPANLAPHAGKRRGYLVCLVFGGLVLVLAARIHRLFR